MATVHGLIRKENLKMKKLYTLLIIFLCTMILLSACNNSDSDDESIIDNIAETFTGNTIREAALGQTFEFDDLEITLSSNIGYTKARHAFLDIDRAYVFYIPITIKNIGNSSNILNPFMITLFPPDGISVNYMLNSIELDLAFNTTSILTIDRVQPGVTAEGHLYILYAEDGEYVIEFYNFDGDEVEVKFDVTFDFDAVPEIKTEFELGETLELDGMEITIGDVAAWGIVERINSIYYREIYFTVPVHLHNVSDESQSFPLYHTFGPDGNQLEFMAAHIESDSISTATVVLPGTTQTGYTHIQYVGNGVYTILFNDFRLGNLSFRFPIKISPNELPVIQTEFAFGETFEVRDFEITIHEDVQWKLVDNYWSVFDGRYIMAFPTTVTNNGDSTNNLSSLHVRFYGPDGDALSRVTFATDDDDIVPIMIDPGATMQGYIHVLYDGAGEYAIEFSEPLKNNVKVVFTVMPDAAPQEATVEDSD